MKTRIAALLLAFAAASCPAQTTTSPTDVLATIGSDTITRGELESKFSIAPPDLRAKGIRFYLKETVDFRALLALARKKGYDKNPAVLARIRPRMRETVARLVFNEEKAKLPPLDAAELKKVYESRKDLMHEPESLELIELQGTSEVDAQGFAIVAQRTRGGIDGLGEPLKKRTRDLGRVHPEMLPPGTFEKLRQVPPGRYSQPFNLGKSWATYFVKARNPARTRPFAEVEPALRRALENERDEQVLRAVVEDCARKTPIKLYPERLDNPDSATVVAEVGGEKLIRQDLLEELARADNVSREFFTQEKGRRLLLERMAQRECLAQEAQSRKELIARWKTQLDYAADREAVETLVQEEGYSKLSLDDAEGQRYYKEHIAKFGREQVRSSHILFSKRGAGYKEKAEKALARVRAGEDFHEVARQESEDPSTKPKGGDLGWFGRGFLVKEYEDFVFSAPEGMITSRPVESMYGAHVIFLEERRKAIPYEQVREPVMKELTEKRRTEAYDALVKSAREQLAVKVTPETLPPDPEPPKPQGAQRITITSDGTIEVGK